MKSLLVLRRTLASGLFVLLAAQALAAPPEPTERERAMLQELQQPNEVFAAKLKGPQEVVAGRALHPKIQWALENARTAAAQNRQDQLEKWKDAAYRAQSRAAVDRTWNYRTKVTAEMERVEDREIDGPGSKLKLRIYTPRTTEKGPLPILVYFHGGGWLFGSVEAADRATRLIANEARAIVVSASYRLSPEAKFPAPQDDAMQVYRWVRAHATKLGGKPDLVAIGGDSAGGQMALVTSLRLIKAGEKPPAYQLLYYPAADMGTEYKSYEQFGSGYGLDRNLAELVFVSFFADQKDRLHPDASPLRAASFRGLPPTLIATAGFDILHDVGEQLAQRMQQDRVAVLWKDYTSLNHGFMQHSGTIDDAERACVETAQIFGDVVRGRVPKKFN
ncbi:alpha/beta hydrolase [Roseiterribacter gracilis]|uniref:Alpha/beta hydrolase fold-3 domain-containing protein n=1 Tax=Roseiterribacter gracilis TaxID=2812848 RepID=A0A8S8X8T7_9PROT|nr:hypothetical protein TMPK1_13510 [Rhodospirillales bacterium TMPK1]